MTETKNEQQTVVLSADVLKPEIEQILRDAAVRYGEYSFFYSVTVQDGEILDKTGALTLKGFSRESNAASMDDPDIKLRHELIGEILDTGAWAWLNTGEQKRLDVRFRYNQPEVYFYA